MALTQVNVHLLNDMIYVYYNLLRLWVKQIDKSPKIDAISLDENDTTESMEGGGQEAYHGGGT
jgi:hypothetical protein